MVRRNRITEWHYRDREVVFFSLRPAKGGERCWCCGRRFRPGDVARDTEVWDDDGGAAVPFCLSCEHVVRATAAPVTKVRGWG